MKSGRALDRRWARSLMVLCLAVVAVAASPARAQTERPAVAFTDDREITLKAQESLRFELTNLLSQKQAVTVSVVGLQPTKDGFVAGRFDPKVVSLERRQTKEVTLTWQKTGVQPTEASYAGGVVVVGDRGPLVRQALTITTDAEPAATPTKRRTVKKWLSDLTKALDGFLDTVTGLGLAFLGWIALLVGSLAVLLWLASRNTKLREWLVDLPKIGPPLDDMLAPRLAVDDFGDKASFSALVRDALIRQRGDEPYRLDRVTDRQSLGDRLVSVDAVDPALKTLGTVLKLIETVMPRASFTATGAVQEKHLLGEGATVTLDGPGETQSATLWLGKDAVAEDDHQPLAVPVAAWIDWEVHSQLNEPPPDVVSPESYSLLQGALDCERRGDIVTAERMYDRAKAVDPTNTAAITNLANLRARSRHEYRLAIDELREAIEILRSGKR